MSVAVMACFVAALLALRRDRRWLAGMALGLLTFKPQFLLAIPVVLLLARDWRTFAGLAASAGAQLSFAWICFGPTVMRAYCGTLWHVSRWLGTAEPGLASIQMHSLRAFWSLLLPWPGVTLALYLLSSAIVAVLSATVWKSACPTALRFSTLTLAAVLVNPHLFVYDLLVLAPVLLLLADWTLSVQHPTAFRLPLYLAFVLPLLGPLSRWTHVQFSVPVFAALLLILWRCSSGPACDAARLALNETADV